MRQKTPKNPKARNSAAHASLQSYFDRISHSLEDRVSEYVQMKKYIRVYEESKKLLEIQKAINIAAGSIYEINIDKKLELSSIKNLIKLLKDKEKALKSFFKDKPKSLQIKFIQQISKHILIVIKNILEIYKNISRISELVPVIKALLKMPDKESNYENDPILIEISNALTISINEPNLAQIKSMLEKERINLSQYDAKLNFEHLNDVSDKFIGLLNDKLLLIIGVSEFLIAGVDDDGANDVAAEQRLPDELRVLFLGSAVLDIIYRLKEIKMSMKMIYTSIKQCLQIMESDRLDNSLKNMLKNGDNNVHDILSNTTPNVLQRIKKAIVEITPGLDALDLKLKLDTLDIKKVIQMTYGLIYEKANRIWENPYDI